MQDIKILIYGPNGKMGKVLLELINQDSSLQLAGTIGPSDSQETLLTVLAAADLAIDFTTPTALPRLLEAALQTQKPLIIGTTGLQREEITTLEKAAQTLPIVFSPNFSIGVNTLFWLAKKTTQLLGNEYDVEIIETHHRFKKDAPSGTACHLGEIIAAARQKEYEKVVQHGRSGMTKVRPPDEIGMHALRVGDVAGDHTVIFGTLGERLELTYKASKRDVFAAGALKAAAWVMGQPPGLYDMQDVLMLKS
jgi:4-hydroxy-tetrahydrodipicolinate reductase